jgi:predicted DNA-binding protein
MTKLRKSTESPEGLPVATSLRISREQHERLKALAAREHRSISQQLRHTIEEITADVADADPEREAA